MPKVVRHLVDDGVAHFPDYLIFAGADGFYGLLEERYLIRQHQVVVIAVGQGNTLVQPQQPFAVVDPQTQPTGLSWASPR